MNELSPATFDYVCASLVCPICGCIADNDCSIELQTKLARIPQLQQLRVGDSIDLTPDIRSAGYLHIGSSEVPKELRVIETWSCPQCGTNFLWARLTLIVGELIIGEIIDIVAVDLHEELLAVTDYITSGVLFLAPIEDSRTLRALDPAALRRQISILADAQRAYQEEQYSG